MKTTSLSLALASLLLLAAWLSIAWILRSSARSRSRDSSARPVRSIPTRAPVRALRWPIRASAT